MTRLLLLLVFLAACGPTHKKKGKHAPELKVQLENKKIELLEELDIEDSWIERDDCDGLLWNSLAKIGGADIELHQAEGQPGEWFRRPSQDCWTSELGDNGSKSTISNDMLTGLLYALYKDSDPGVSDLYAYGKEHNWVMGSPFPKMASRVVLRPNGIYLVSRIIEVMYKVRKPELDHIAVVNPYFKVSKDFEKHIQTVGILLTMELEKEATEQIRDRIRENADEYPNDALFQAACGWFDIQALMRSADLILTPGYEAPSYIRDNEQHYLIHQLFTIYVIQEVLL